MSLESLKDATAFCKPEGEIAPHARVVGSWVWVEFDSKPSVAVRQKLKDAGFRWNRKRGAWQHSCGGGRSRMSRTDPRMNYGSFDIDSMVGDFERGLMNEGGAY